MDALCDDPPVSSELPEALGRKYGFCDGSLDDTRVVDPDRVLPSIIGRGG
jgi:hypothetical protein